MKETPEIHRAYETLNRSRNKRFQILVIMAMILVFNCGNFGISGNYGNGIGFWQLWQC